jgi:hypothetical protein
MGECAEGDRTDGDHSEFAVITQLLVSPPRFRVGIDLDCCAVVESPRGVNIDYAVEDEVYR